MLCGPKGLSCSANRTLTCTMREATHWGGLLLCDTGMPLGRLHPSACKSSCHRVEAPEDPPEGDLCEMMTEPLNSTKVLLQATGTALGVPGALIDDNPAVPQNRQMSNSEPESLLQPKKEGAVLCLGARPLTIGP